MVGVQMNELLSAEIEHMYCGMGMSRRVIADVFGVTSHTISTWMKEFGIEARTKLGDSVKPSKKELEKMYLDQGMSQLEIANEIGVTNMTVSRWIRKYGINPRTKSEAKLVNSMRPLKENLEKMYLEKEMSMTEIANEIGVSCQTIFTWMKEFGIESRTKFTGENAGNWQGGISFEPYCIKFNNTFREAVRERDDYTCQLCGYEQELNVRKLSIHHIHYDKENCYPDVVALCCSCNTKVNFNRDYWEEYFENQLIERGLFCWSIGKTGDDAS